MTIYNVPSLVRDALPQAITPLNIMKGFKVSGIEPFNRNIFSEDDFLPASVTDQPLGNAENSASENSLPSPQMSLPSNGYVGPDQPSTSAQFTEDEIENHKNQKTHTTPEQADFSPLFVRPLPKAGERKPSSRGRKKRKSAVLTDTPEKDALEAEQNNLVSKKGKEIIKQKVKKVKRKVVEESDESDEECLCLVCTESYSKSKPKEKWVKCTHCKLWSHEDCTDGRFPYICHHCESDSD